MERTRKNPALNVTKRVILLPDCKYPHIITRLKHDGIMSKLRGLYRPRQRIQVELYISLSGVRFDMAHYSPYR